jgi:Tfp pilus assembly protein PilP
LYFAGAKLACFFPVSIPGHGIALNMTVQSYNGLLEVGLTACRRAMPDVADLADYVVEEHHKLRALIEALPAPEPLAVVAAVQEPVAKKPRAKPKATTVAPAKKTPARRRTVAALGSAPVAAKRVRKSATAAARAA